MDSSQIPPVQPMQPAMPFQPAMPTGQTTANGAPMVQQVNVLPEPKHGHTDLIKTIIIVIVSLIAVTFIGLFVWMYMQYDEARTDVDGQINTAVLKAKDEQAMEMEKEFSEREKYPFRTFSGPVDYGQLTFEYPKNWSVYVAAAADRGGDFNAYFNPNQVDAVGRDTINALRVTILNRSFDDVVENYQRELEGNTPRLTMQSIVFGKEDNITGNRYAGKIPGTELEGFIVIFKIRDKTVIMQTDSVLFQADFDKILTTITFNA